VNRIIRENRHFTISEVYEQCPDVSRTVVYEIVTEHLQYRKILWTLGTAPFWYEEGIRKLVSRYD
jgi:hypothetical protein